MSKRNNSLEKPYVPKRDPREANIVNRINKLKGHKVTYVNDDSIEYSDAPNLIGQLLKGEDVVGTPGGLVPLDDNGLIDTKYLPPEIGGTSIQVARTLAEFPPIGDDTTLYVATEENDGKGYIYRWCEGLHCYERPEDSLDDVSEICGGCAEDI